MLFPIIVPRRYDRDGRWIGPMKRLKHPELAVTWVVLNDGGTMSYVNHEAAARYVAEGIDYQSEAMRNLRRDAEGALYTHDRTDDDGSEHGRTLFVVAMHEDGLGSSRLLLLPEWREEFPEGFVFGLPERSCAFVVPADLSEAEQAIPRKIVGECFASGTTKMLPGLHDPSLFEYEDDPFALSNADARDDRPQR